MTSRRVQRAAHRLADQQASRFDELPVSRLLVLSVVAIDPGASTDGRDLVTVRWRGEDIVVEGYDRTKTFQVNDRVRCSVVNDQLFIDFPLGGFPPDA